jgi:hypothetical protein
LVGAFGNNIAVSTCVFISSFMIFTVCEGANGVVHKVSTEIIHRHVRGLRRSWG